VIFSGGMKMKYYVCGLGYDENNHIMDFEQFFGLFDEYVDAYELFVKLQCKESESLFTNNNVCHMLIQIEECIVENETSTCIDVKNEWWIDNPNFNSNLKDYKNIALRYAEKHGIIEYYIKNNTMIYYSSFPIEHKTIKAVVNLDTLKEDRKYLSRYYCAYNKKIGGKIQANYCV
jgi:hypothetical protein